MDKKYKLTKEMIEIDGRTLYRIKALRDFDNVKKGELGGFIEKEENLSHAGLCWVSENAKVYGRAMVRGNAEIYGNAEVCGYAKVSADAKVFGHAEIYGNAKVFGYAEVFGHAKVYDDANVYEHAKVSADAIVFGYAKVSGHAEIGTFARITSPNDYIVIGPIGSRNGYTTVHRILNTDNQSCSSDLRIQCGCFNGSPDEFFTKVDETHVEGTLYHAQYTTIVKPIVDAMSRINVCNITDKVGTMGSEINKD